MYGVVSRWDNTYIVWYDKLSEAFDHADTGDTVVKKIEVI